MKGNFMKFNIGDRVKVTDEISCKYGQIGTIIAIDTDGCPYYPLYVEFGYRSSLHYAEEDLELVVKNEDMFEVTETDMGITEIKAIKDSGHRRDFDTGAQRDRAEGKGIPTLISCLAMCNLLKSSNDKFNKIEYNLWMYVKTKNISYLRIAWGYACDKIVHPDVNSDVNSESRIPEIIVSQQLEAGAKKYSARNWEKGMPVAEYLNSAFRHLWKWRWNHTDEDHPAAFLFNVMGAIHTLVELERNNYPDTLAPDWPDYTETDKLKSVQGIIEEMDND